jgi:hypothetical protein
MVGKNPLWVAKQHGHSISTMLRVYAAWAEGAAESDIDAIKRSMNRRSRLRPAIKCRLSAGVKPRAPRATHPRPKRTTLIGNLPGFGNLAVDLPVETGSKAQVPDNWRKLMAEREGFEPDSDPLSDQQVTDSENNPVPTDPQKAP